ncbi:unnamed protein product [Rotaria sordida]|uniref:Uncharacterized protein n=1 Tax=Rotaria sordida TaxID=392033 RepID=A0A815TND5_9BILA|nr:unnamed protein product [Rotaria sordida]CAF1658518.1 unnamed protein product [Rotaria sordida]
MATTCMARTRMNDAGSIPTHACDFNSCNGEAEAGFDECNLQNIRRVNRYEFCIDQRNTLLRSCLDVRMHDCINIGK